MSTRPVAVFRVAVELTLLFAALISFPCAAQTDWGTPAQEEALARARVDLRRSQIGLPALPLNALLETAARGHADYLKRNNLSGHNQNKAQYPDGFTGNTPSERIAAAGYASVPGANGGTSLTTGEVVARGSFYAENAVDTLIQAIYHRVGIFGTAFDEQGAGVSQGSQGLTVINFGSRKYPRPTAPTGWIGVYPYDGQTGIAVDFYSDEESPDPMPTLNRVGYPVSLHIDDARVLLVTGFTLAKVDAGGNTLQNLAVQLLTKAGGDTHLPASVAAIIPLAVLEYGTRYEANFSGTADGAALSKTWRFTTAPYSALAIAGTPTVYVGDTVGLKFSGGSGRYVNAGYNYTAPAGQGAPLSQAGLVGSDGYSFHADGTGTINVTVTDGENTSATLQIAIKSAAEKLLPLGVGWNLAGNSTSVPLAVATMFGNNASNVTTVWKWVPSGTSTGISYPAWAFYAPSLPDGGAAYAASKGYDFLTTIGAGDGFWVNAKAGFSMPLPAGATVSTTSLRSTLRAGWNLVGAGDNRTPRGFNSASGPAPATPGDIPLNLTSLWAWNNTLSNWYFYAPSLDKSGGLAGYIQQKSYLDFGAKTLDPLLGFWVNRP